MVGQRRGGPRALAPAQVSATQLGPEDVRIAVRAAGVAFGDFALLEGLVRGARSPLVPGYDVVGTVTEVGERAAGRSVGEPVVAWTGGSGGWASEVVLPAWQVVPTGPGLDPPVVDALVLNYLAAYQMLSRTAPLPAGSAILVHSAAGGIGTALLQLGRLRGLRMFGTASGTKAALVSRLGATPIDYRNEDFAARIRTEAPEGLDAIFDGLGPRTWRRGLPLLSAGGRLVAYGMTDAFRNGRRSIPALARAVATSPRPSTLSLFSRGRGVEGYSSTPMFTEHRDWYREDLAALLELLRAGDIAPVVHRVYPLREAGAALEDLASGRAAGKIVLELSEQPRS